MRTIKIPKDKPSLYVDYGDLGRIAKTVAWYSCRDAFDRTNIENIMLFKSHTEKFKEFISLAEDKLKLSARQRAKIRNTNRVGVYHITLGPFWKTKARRSLLTALLRVSRGFDGTNFDSLIKNSNYFYHNLYAIGRFFEGYTEITKRGGGWVNKFIGKTKEQVDEILQKKKRTIKA